MRITLVEDNESLRKGLTYRLNDEGHTVDALSDGLEAEEFLKSETSDLVILDVNLPGQSGFDVLRAMRARAGTETLDVPRRELALLSSLAQAPGTAMSKTQLLDALYGAGADADEKVIEVYVSRLRKRLAGHGVTISVRRGIGYFLEIKG